MDYRHVEKRLEWNSVLYVQKLFISVKYVEILNTLILCMECFVIDYT